MASSVCLSFVLFPAPAVCAARGAAPRLPAARVASLVRLARVRGVAVIKSNRDVVRGYLRDPPLAPVAAPPFRRERRGVSASCASLRSRSRLQIINPPAPIQGSGWIRGKIASTRAGAFHSARITRGAVQTKARRRSNAATPPPTPFRERRSGGPTKFVFWIIRRVAGQGRHIRQEVIRQEAKQRRSPPLPCDTIRYCRIKSKTEILYNPGNAHNMRPLLCWRDSCLTVEYLSFFLSIRYWVRVKK